MSENKQALQVAALKNGTVIDHIPSEKLFTVVQLLGVEQMTSNITIGFNLDSKKLGKKGHTDHFVPVGNNMPSGYRPHRMQSR